MSYDADADQTHLPGRCILIVGGVAGGASCAARLRRLDESVEIAIFDRGPYVAFANCGLPYYVGDVIADERTLLVASREMFREQARRRSGHRCREWTCPVFSRCATSRTRAVFVPGLPIVAPALRSSSSAALSDWRWKVAAGHTSARS